MKTIRISGLRVMASVGILPHELEAKQQLLISLKVELAEDPLHPAQDSVEHVLDYRELRSVVLAHAESGHINMLETLAARILSDLRSKPGVTCAEVSITKPNIFPDCDGVTVSVAS
jgi:7,8-dihydroneopterin aldolase/epimerase/oxygenase